MELKIPLPTAASSSSIPNDISYRWCKALHEALQPLRKYKLADNSEALDIVIAAGFNLAAEICGPFDEPVKWDMLQKNDAVLRIMTMRSSQEFIDVIYFHYKDFQGCASVAREKFARVIAHLEEHAVPQIAPEWITRILVALQSK